MSGRLFVIEGSDASGKSTQLDLLCERFEQEGRSFRKVIFPRYGEDSSMLARMYLDGLFGSDPGDVGPYAASVFFAVDRYASFKTDWGGFYDSGGLVVCHRYTTANAIHQAVKLEGSEREEFLDWLFDFEYNRMNIPRPSRVIFLDMPPAASLALMDQRNLGQKRDIHESNRQYLEKCYEVSRHCADKYGWSRISCLDGEDLRPREDIHREIYKLITGEVYNA